MREQSEEEQAIPPCRETALERQDQHRLRQPARKGDLRRNTGLTEVGFDQDFHFMLVEIDGRDLHFQAISRTGQTVDSGVIHQAAGHGATIAAPAPAGEAVPAAPVPAKPVAQPTPVAPAGTAPQGTTTPQVVAPPKAAPSPLPTPAPRRPRRPAPKPTPRPSPTPPA